MATSAGASRHYGRPAALILLKVRMTEKLTQICQMELIKRTESLKGCRRHSNWPAAG